MTKPTFLSRKTLMYVRGAWVVKLNSTSMVRYTTCICFGAGLPVTKKMKMIPETFIPFYLDFL